MRTSPLSSAMRHSCSRLVDRREICSLFLSLAAWCASAAHPANAVTPPGITPVGVAEAELPAAVIMMRAAGLAQLQESMLRTSSTLTNEERFAQGLALGRGQASMSVKQLLQNTQLAKLPGCAKPASTLADLSRTVSKGDGPLTAAELLKMAGQYQLARQQIQAALEKLPEAQRRDAADLEAKLRVADEEAKKPFWSEGGRFASGQMGSCGGATEMGMCDTAPGVPLDESTRRERAEYLARTMDSAHERLKEQRLERSENTAGEALYQR